MTVAGGRALFDGGRELFFLVPLKLRKPIARVDPPLHLAAQPEFEAAMTETNTLRHTYVGTWIGASWGTTTRHHPRFLSHGHEEPEFHAVELDLTITIDEQHGRALAVTVSSNHHDDHAVGVLSEDGSRLLISTNTTVFHLGVDSNTLTGEATGRPHGEDRAGENFSVGMISLSAQD